MVAARDFALSLIDRTRRRQSITFLIGKWQFPQKEVAMHLEPRCSHCDSEDPKIISLRDPARERYCGRFCLDKGHENFIRWIRRTNAEAAS